MNRSRAGFSLVELLVASAIAAAVLTTGVLVYQNLSRAGATRPSYGQVEVGANLGAFFGGNATTLDAYFAPSYGRAALAEQARTQFLADVQRASAVFCLGRESANTYRPSTITLAAGFRGDTCDTPEAFRSLLASADATAASTFVAYRGASPATNASIFIVVPGGDEQTLAILAVWDIDLTPATLPSALPDGTTTGTYASVKRYEGGSLTTLYDVFYPASAGTHAFNPLVVAFERASRLAVVEGTDVDRFKVAAARPFYFVWWPDPAAPTLEGFSTGSFDASDPRQAYASMGARTAFFFVVPMFPAL